jgi:hypothetical protein
MRSSFKAGLLSSALWLGLFSVTALAQPQPRTTQRDPKAIALIIQSLTAMGLSASPTLETLAQGTLTDSSELRGRNMSD